ncbi:hypothetical protein Ae201684P_021122 [Aphanomyces euteiches]|uniref:Uncharacterized protein n=1 Tax=Aphanomyces euteiches TaxID=100861 RepID=A0A6G0WH43_9STRA|nr:hypothetical protein Ae201684_015287 [Aphanomyces euteiches]KAH9071985.1 hypothetical protein Ae201684P_021122 [Aphanomyces euteiches]
MMARHDAFESSQDASQQALMSPDILQLICQFQPGLWEDMLSFLPLQGINHAFEITLAHMDDIQVVLMPWYNVYGLGRIPRLVAALPFMKFIVLAFSARVGDTQLLRALARTCKVDIVPRVGDLLTIAIDSNQVDVIASLECVGYTPEIHKKRLIDGIGDAVARGHMTMAQYLAYELNQVNLRALRASLNGNTQAKMSTNLKMIFATKNFEGLQWLLNIWTHLLPPTWMSRCRRECRLLALEHQAWHILVMLSTNDVNPAAKYDKDLILAAKLASLEAVHWLLSTAGVVVKYHHIVQAAKYFRSDNPNSSLLLERLLAMWLPTLTELESKVQCLDICMNEAVKSGHFEAVQMIWRMGASKSTLQRYGTPTTMSEFANLCVSNYGENNNLTSLHWSCDWWISIKETKE